MVWLERLERAGIARERIFIDDQTELKLSNNWRHQAESGTLGVRPSWGTVPALRHPDLPRRRPSRRADQLLVPSMPEVIYVPASCCTWAVAAATASSRLFMVCLSIDSSLTVPAPSTEDINPS